MSVSGYISNELMWFVCSKLTTLCRLEFLLNRKNCNIERDDFNKTVFFNILIVRKWHKLQKIRFIREQGRLFQSERAKYAGTFAIDLTIL